MMKGGSIVGPTIRDIAKAANVSTAAVSYVINDKPGVSEETRLKIQRIMREMNYRPNPQARGLAAKRTGMLGLMIPDITDPFYVNVVRGVEAESNQLGYTLTLCTTHGDAERERNVAGTLTSNWVDGVIMMAYKLSPSELEKLSKHKVPIVVIDNPEVAGLIPSIMVNNTALGRTATAYLVEMGHTRIGFIHGVEGSNSSAARYEGYVQALKSHGLEPDPDLVERGDFSYEHGLAAAHRLLSLPNRPTAIFAANDQMAFGVMNAATELGLSVPEDISVIGVDDIEAAALVVPGLTTMRQPTWEIGACAVQILERLINPPEDSQDSKDAQSADASKSSVIQRVFEAELVVRGSCAPPTI
jgi:LacI family transcriptional regulator